MNASGREAQVYGKGHPGVYNTLVIVASFAATERWLGDDAGQLVPKEVGKLRMSLVLGACVVACGLGTSPYPIYLTQARQHSEPELDAGATLLTTDAPTANRRGQRAGGRHFVWSLGIGYPAQPVGGADEVTRAAHL